MGTTARDESPAHPSSVRQPGDDDSSRRTRAGLLRRLRFREGARRDAARLAVPCGDDEEITDRRANERYATSRRGRPVVFGNFLFSVWIRITFSPFFVTLVLNFRLGVHASLRGGTHTAGVYLDAVRIDGHLPVHCRDGKTRTNRKTMLHLMSRHFLDRRENAMTTFAISLFTYMYSCIAERRKTQFF